MLVINLVFKMNDLFCFLPVHAYSQGLRRGWPICRADASLHKENAVLPCTQLFPPLTTPLAVPLPRCRRLTPLLPWDIVAECCFRGVAPATWSQSALKPGWLFHSCVLVQFPALLTALCPHSQICDRGDPGSPPHLIRGWGFPWDTISPSTKGFLRCISLKTGWKVTGEFQAK